MIPVYNEAERIINVLSACENIIDIFVIINDGSLDKTMYIINGWSKGKANIHIINSKMNRGMSCAVKEGLRFIQNNRDKLSIKDNDVIIQIDGDDQHNVYNIDEIIDYMEVSQIDYLYRRELLSKQYPVPFLFLQRR